METLNQADIDLLKNQALSGLVSYFRSTPEGQKLEAEYIKQGVADYSSNPLLLCLVAVLVFIIIYPYFKK